MTSSRLRTHYRLADTSIRCVVVFGATLLSTADFSACARGAQPSAQRSNDPELYRTFLMEAPRKWKEYGARLKRLQGTIENKVYKNGNLSRHFVQQIKQNGPNEICVQQQVAGDFPPDAARGGYVWGRNRQYAFGLRRPMENAPWFIADLSTVDIPSEFTKIGGRAALADILQALVILPGEKHLQELVDYRAFKIENVRNVEGVGLEITFDCAHPYSEKPFFPIQRGKIVLDPDQYYCLRSAEVLSERNKRKFSSHLTTEYCISPGGYPVPILWLEEQDGTDPKGVPARYIREARYTLHEPTELPADDEFTLSAFGFAEPGVDAGRSKWLFWLLIMALAGIVVFVCGASLRRAGRKRAGTE